MNDKNDESKMVKKELEINMKICLEIVLVVFSMCLVIFLMFFAAHDKKEEWESNESQEHKEAFEQTEFYKIISYEISKNAGECENFEQKYQPSCFEKI